MSYADELEDMEVKEAPVPWDEHAAIVKKSYDDGIRKGANNLIKKLEKVYEETKDENILGVLQRVAGNEFEKNSIMRMRPDPKWKDGLEALCSLFPKDAVMVEIGCYSGESTEIFANHVGKIYAIDPWKPAEGEKACEDTHNYTHKLDVAERVFDEMASTHPNIFKMKGFDSEVVDAFPDESLDAVYIDGNHYEEAVKKNITAWLPKVKKTGFICGHDYYDITPGVVKAVDDILGKPDFTFADFSWAFRVADHRVEGKWIKSQTTVEPDKFDASGEQEINLP
jgi:predicted O-methyltransferase YrrM